LARDWIPNPNGRPVGSRNKRDAELLARLEARGDRLAVDLLSEIANDTKEPKPLRVQAMAVLAPYQTAKFGLVPAAPPQVFIEAPELPHPYVSELTHVVENIEFLSALRREGKLDLAAADALVADQRIAGAHLIEHQKAIAANPSLKPQQIQILGGLPPLPGAEDIDLDGSQFAARVAAARYSAVVNGEKVRDGLNGPPVPVIPPEGSPLAEKPGMPKHPVGDPEPGDA
jgi:hypothetical protein